MPTAPQPNTDPNTLEPRSAAEHCAAAEELFTRARGHAEDAAEYERCLGWAGMHLRMAEAITAGARLVTAHRELLANPDVRLHNTYLSCETKHWTEFFQARHDTNERTHGRSI